MSLSLLSRAKQYRSVIISITILLALTILLRIPNFLEPYWYTDEGIYLTIGQQLRLGNRLYVDIVDHKTPLLYWLSSVAYTLPRLKAVLLLFSLSSVIIFYFICSQLFQKNSTKFILTTVFALAISLPRYEGNIFNAELIFMPFILAAIWLFWSNFPHKNSFNTLVKLEFYPQNKLVTPIVIGLFFGLAFLTKAPTLFDFLALISYIVFFIPDFWHPKHIHSNIKYVALIFAGFIVVIISSLIHFYLRGSLSEYIDFGFLYNFRYISEWSNPFQHPISLMLSSALGRGILMLLGLSSIKYTQKFQSPALTFSLIWLVFTASAATLSLRPYPHYLLQVIPPCILAIGFIPYAHKIAAALTGVLLAIIIFIFNQLNIQTYSIRDYYVNTYLYATNQRSLNTFLQTFDPNIPENYQLSKVLQQQTYFQQPVYIHGDRPILYAQSEVAPATKYTAHFHVKSTNDYQYVLERLTDQPPKFILDDIRNRNSFPELYHLLDFNYLLLLQTDQVDVYQLFSRD